MPTSATAQEHPLVSAAALHTICNWYIGVLSFHGLLVLLLQALCCSWGCYQLQLMLLQVGSCRVRGNGSYSCSHHHQQQQILDSATAGVSQTHVSAVQLSAVQLTPPSAIGSPSGMIELSGYFACTGTATTHRLRHYSFSSSNKGRRSSSSSSIGSSRGTDKTIDSLCAVI